MDYRIIISFIILAVALCSTGILFAKKRLNKKKVITVIALSVIAIIAVWGIKLQSTKDYYKSKIQSTNTGKSESSVIIKISCATVTNKKSDIDIPADGIILKKTAIPINKGDSVMDVLIRATKQKKIALDYEGGEDGSLGSAYVKGINDLYEFDFGDQSGWLYKVNSKFSGTACGDYKVKAKDVIEWVYTCDLGKDVGRK